MTRCKGREQPEGLTFALRRNGRTRSFLNRYCGSWTSISPNFVCQRTFFHLGDASEVADEFPSPSPPPASPPSPAALRVPNAASPPPTALPQRPPPSNRLRYSLPSGLSTRHGFERQDGCAKRQTALHRSNPRPSSASSSQITSDKAYSASTSATTLLCASPASARARASRPRSSSRSKARRTTCRPTPATSTS